ncbi:MAG: hypothetical protein CENE_03405 [Candidatus Celerinatantimonas neptuna]|nr:MAG: hypothetical protein CENE_03405 [Candidatus Celerinatantimonas neptuna]
MTPNDLISPVTQRPTGPPVGPYKRDTKISEQPDSQHKRQQEQKKSRSDSNQEQIDSDKRSPVEKLTDHEIDLFV